MGFGVHWPKHQSVSRPLPVLTVIETLSVCVWSTDNIPLIVSKKVKDDFEYRVFKYCIMYKGKMLLNGKSYNYKEFKNIAYRRLYYWGDDRFSQVQVKEKNVIYVFLEFRKLKSKFAIFRTNCGLQNFLRSVFSFHICEIWGIRPKQSHIEIYFDSFYFIFKPVFKSVR